MFYKNDFNNHIIYRRYNANNNNEINLPNVEVIDGESKSVIKKKKITSVEKNYNNEQNGTDYDTFTSVVKNYFHNSTVHGFKYIVQSDIHITERITWMIVVITALIGVIYVSLLLSEKFSSSPLATVVESTIYPVSDIPYPAVTICNYNRINWRRLQEAKDIFIPDADDETNELFEILVASFSLFEYGSFDDFNNLVNYKYNKLEHINLTQLYEITMHRCEEIFTGTCWWRNKFLPCCSIFVKQKSEFGICHAFNSIVNEEGSIRVENETDWPWRTSNYGDWSGLRVFVNSLPAARLPNSTELSGFIVIVHNPNEWPTSGYFIPEGTSTSVVIKPTFSYTTSGVRRLTPEQRQCVFPDECETQMDLPGLTCLRTNCVAECRQRHMVKLCNCSVDFMYPIGNYVPCNISGLVCLSNYDAILNYEKPQSHNKYFSDEEEGIECPCLPECNRLHYGAEYAPIIVNNQDSQNLMLLDIHFQYATLLKYRTDVVFGYMDLIVSFGGIAGLFLGCSLLSFVEICYYCLYAMYTVIYKRTIKPENITRITNVQSMQY